MGNKAKKFKYASLFSGIGSCRIVLSALGGECVFSSDKDKWCRQTYEHNFGSVPAGDIKEVRISDIPAHDLLTAEFPCQPFSAAGVSKRNSLGTPHGFKDKIQGTLFFDIVKIIEFHRPKIVQLENVKNLVHHDRGKTFKVILKTLEALHYQVFWKVINAKDFSCQNRARIFIVCFDRFNSGPVDFTFPEGEKNSPPLFSILEESVDEKYTLSDRLWGSLQRHHQKHKAAGNGFGFGLCDSTTKYSRTLSARYHKDGAEILIKQDGKNPRRLTPRECARLQGFPESFKIPVSNTQAYRQFGNTVSLFVLKRVMENVVKHL